MQFVYTITIDRAQVGNDSTVPTSTFLNSSTAFLTYVNNAH